MNNVTDDLLDTELDHGENMYTLSTDLLLGKNLELQHSTRSLINKNIKDLIGRVEPMDSSNTKQTFQSYEMNNYQSFFQHDFGEPNVSHAFNHSIYSQLIPNDLLSHENNPIISKLYDMVQKFLLKHGLSMDFLIIFQRYLMHLADNSIDPLQDEYFLILQNELSKTCQFTNIMENMINTFLFKPTNFSMKLAYLEHKHMKVILNRFFSSWALKYNMNISLHALESIWEKYIQKKYLSVLFKKMETVVIAMHQDANNMVSFRTKSHFWDIWLRQLDAYNMKLELADNFYTDTKFQKFKQKFKLYQKHNEMANKFTYTVLVKFYLNSWKLRYKQSSFVPTTNLLVVRNVLYVIKDKLAKIKEQEIFSDFTRKNILLRPIVLLWLRNLKMKTLIYKKLNMLKEGFIINKFFHLILKVWGLRQRNLIIQENLNKVLLQNIFNKIWRERLHDRTIFYQIMTLSYGRIVSKLFLLWKKKYYMLMKSVDFYNTYSKNKFLKQIKLNSKVQAFLKMHKYSRIHYLFEKWKVNLKLQKKIIVCNTKLLLYYWDHKFKQKYNSFCDLEYITSRCYDSKLIKVHFAKWRTFLKDIEKLNIKAVLFKQLRIILKIKSAIAKTKAVKIKERMIYLRMSNGTINRIFCIWKNNVILQKNYKLEIILDSYEAKCISTLLRKLLVYWKEKWFFYEMKCASVAIRNLKHRYGQTFFLTLMERMSLHLSWKIEASHIRTNMLLTIYIGKWIESYHTIQQMKYQLQRSIEERNLSIILYYMNKWSMKNFKYKRNYETVDMFKNRWNRAYLRAIMILWKEKTIFSPKRRVYNIDRQVNFTQTLPNIFTPTKANIKNFTIPGSEKAKRNKMEKIKNRFRSVRRAIPSPIKSSDALDSPSKRQIGIMGYSDISNSFHIDNTVPKMNLRSINKKLASRLETLDFGKIPDINPFGNSSLQQNKIILDNDEPDELGSKLDGSPTRVKRSK